MNCFRRKKWWRLKETQNPSKIGLENWNFGILRKNYSSERINCFSKREYFQKSLELERSVLVSGKCLWLVFFELFEERRFRLLKLLIWRGRGVTVTHKKDHKFFLWWVLLASFHSRLNWLQSLGVRRFSIWWILLI